jgi:protocatechuate 3,4-dioxygenase beta subunit
MAGMIRSPFSRRGLLVGTAGSLLLPLRPGLAVALGATPQQTEGPFYPVSFPTDTDSDLVQVRGQEAQAMGVILHLQGRVLDGNGRALAGTQVEIWQCDSQGLYDHPGQSGRERRDTAFQGYGRVQTDAEGRYQFRTLKPVAYPGRTPHIHLKVATTGGSRLTSQFYIAGDPRNEADFVFRSAARDPRQRERIEMRLDPAPGLEPGALATTMDIVIG